MATEQSRVDRAIETACTKLGYAGLTPDQEKVVKSFVSGQDVFLHHSIINGLFNVCRSVPSLLTSSLHHTQTNALQKDLVSCQVQQKNLVILLSGARKMQAMHECVSILLGRRKLNQLRW